MSNGVVLKMYGASAVSVFVRPVDSEASNGEVVIAWCPDPAVSIGAWSLWRCCCAPFRCGRVDECSVSADVCDELASVDVFVCEWQAEECIAGIGRCVEGP